jgi:hypothetical protein
MRTVRRICGSDTSPSLLILIGAALIGGLILGCSSDRKGVFKPQLRPPGNGEIFSLDLNDDEVEDFVFEYSALVTTDVPSSAGTVFLSICSLGNNMVQYTEEHGPQPFADSTLIGDSLTWTIYGGSLANINWSIDSGWDQIWSGAWAGVSEMSLGLEIIINNSNHFGWVKLSVDSELGTLTVHDYAYQPIPGEPILAGVYP